MKVNRFGMSQKLFMQMVKLWAVSQLMNASRIMVREAKTDECERLVNEIENVIRKTFLDHEKDEDCVDFLKTVDALRERINLERAGRASSAVRPS